MSAVASGCFLLPASGSARPRPSLRQAAGGEGVRPSLRLPGLLQSRAFASSEGADAHYHALVHEGGSAAGKALVTTSVSDAEVAATFRRWGARDGGGVPMAAWDLRRLPLLPQPATRVRGSPVGITVEWEGWTSPRELGDLLADPGGRGVAFRFGGNEEHDHHWDSGCIACLFSCPGGVVSNERYAIRDHVRGRTRFTPHPDLPPDGTPVMVVITLLDG